jgi:23S rRNA (adenine2503-C2)-methyltransferase
MQVAELEKKLALYGLPAYRLKQILQAIYQQGIFEIDNISVLPVSLRQELGKIFDISPLPILKRQISETDKTEKRLLLLDDGESVETVYLAQSYGSSVCVSTQVGCRMGCQMCHSGQNGLKRDLSSQEMFLQLWSFISELGCDTIDNVLLMGSGEPLDNMDACLEFYEFVINPNTLALSNRNFVLSTCGLVPQINRLAALRTKITLAVSLHSAIDSVRERLVPVNRKFGVEVLLDACQNYFLRTKRRVTIEYALIKGINDGPKDLEALILALRGRKGLHLNLIPANSVRSANIFPPENDLLQLFLAETQKAGLTVSVRYSKGNDILAACGQLKGK